MIQLTHLSGSLEGRSSTSERTPLRIGRAADCDVRFDSARDRSVSNHHAEVVFTDGAYHLIDTGSTNGTLVNGRKIVKHRLASGDRIRFGEPDGPEASVTIDLVGIGTSDALPAVRTNVANPAIAAAPDYNAEQDAARMAGAIKSGVRDSATHRVADQMAQQVAEERARAGGLSSGNTMFIMVRALSQVSNAVTAKAKKKWVKVVLLVAGVGVIVAGGMGGVIYSQHQQIARLLAAKAAIDREIEATETQMQQEQDPGRLQQLEAILSTLTGSAERTITQLRATNSVAAAQAQAGGDELDQEIRRILTKFGAPTYDVPPIFRERLQFYINDITHSGNLQAIYKRKVQYWPVITKEFKALGLPDEMAYVAWQESKFDPEAQNESGARGMWQMTTGTAQSLGLRVDGTVDERTDVTKQTHAAARYLANLLAEFGEDSFMLAMASYNRGEAGVRRVLHDVAQEPGGYKKANRDFWHLYRLKKLPEETREYVPKILAAAIIGNNPARYGLAAK